MRCWNSSCLVRSRSMGCAILLKRHQRQHMSFASAEVCFVYRESASQCAAVSTGWHSTGYLLEKAKHHLSMPCW